MIECKVNNREASVMASGSTVEIAVDLCSMIGQIYSALKDNNPDNAVFFRSMMKRSLDDASPVWNCSKNPDVAIVLSRPVKKGEA